MQNCSFKFKINFKFLIAVFNLSFLILNLFASPVFAGGLVLVPCGGTGQNPCELIDIFQLIKNIMNWMMLYGGIFAALFIACGGIMMLLSRGNEARITKAKLWITNAVIGLLFVFCAWLIINTIMIVLDATHKFDWWSLPWKI